MKSKRHHVAICVSLMHGAERDFLTGIFRHLDDGHYWQIDLLQSSPPFSAESLRRLEASGLDGIIISDAREADIIPELVTTAIPLALVSGTAFRKSHPMFRRKGPTVVVHNDNFAITDLGLSHLAACGKFASHGFVPAKRGIIWSDERLMAFAKSMSESGEEIRVFREGETTLADWLKTLPKPTAVMAACDEFAVRVLDTCARLGLTVPTVVSVLGVDNDGLLCRHSTPPLSSVLPDHEGMGYTAARELEKLMSHRRMVMKPRHLTLKPIKVICRESTGYVVPAATLIERARQIAADEANTGISVAEIAKRLNVSQRLLEHRFKTLVGQSLKQLLLRKRLDTARQLIKTTRRPLVRIAKECGYCDAKHLTHCFKKNYGLSPREFRRSET